MSDQKLLKSMINTNILIYRKVKSKLRQIEVQKLKFRDRYIKKNPILVDILLKCLENQYDKRPTFSMLRRDIQEKKLELKSRYKVYKDSLQRFLSSKLDTKEDSIEIENTPKTIDPSSLGIVSNMEFSMYKSQQFNINSKKKQEEVNTYPIISPEKEPSNVKINGKQVESHIFNEKKPEEISEMKMSQYKARIFEDSQDLYYRKIEKKDQIQEVNFGSNFIGKTNEEFKSEPNSAKQKKFIKISEV